MKGDLGLAAKIITRSRGLNLTREDDRAELRGRLKYFCRSMFLTTMNDYAYMIGGSRKRTRDGAVREMVRVIVSAYRNND